MEVNDQMSKELDWSRNSELFFGEGCENQIKEGELNG